MEFKQEYKEFIDTEIHIHLDKEAGTKHSTTMIEASKIGLMTMLTSCIHTLLVKDILSKKDLNYMIELAMLGDEAHESK